MNIIKLKRLSSYYLHAFTEDKSKTWVRFYWQVFGL